MEFDFENENNFETPAATQQEFDDPLFREQSLEESLASLYKPPYSRPSQRPEPTLSEFTFDETPPQPKPAESEAAPIFPENKSSLLSAYDEPLAAPAEPQTEAVSKNKDVFPMLLLAIGAQLLTLGLLLFFFSDDGLLTLQWNAKKWFAYALISLPLIYFGLRGLKIQSHISSSGS